MMKYWYCRPHVWRTHGDPGERIGEGNGACLTPYPGTLNQLLNDEDITRQKTSSSPKELELI